MLADSAPDSLSWDEESAFNKGNSRNARRGQTKTRKFPAAQKELIQSEASPAPRRNATSADEGGSASFSSRSQKRQLRDRHRKRNNKYHSAALHAAHHESSDESDSRSRSSSIISAGSGHRSHSRSNSIAVSPTKLTMQQLSDALQALSTTTPSHGAGSFDGPSGGLAQRTPSFHHSGEGRRPRDGSVDFTGHSGSKTFNPHQLHHSPYYRALFGSPVAPRGLASPGGSFRHPRTHSAGSASDSGDSTPRASKPPPTTPLQQPVDLFGPECDVSSPVDRRLDAAAASPVTTKDCSSGGEGDTDAAAQNERRCVTPLVLSARGDEALWPKLPVPTPVASRRAGAAISFAASPVVRSPGRLSAKKNAGGAEPRRWLRSDKFLNKLLGGAAGSAHKPALLRPKSTPTVSEVPPIGLAASPRKLRFPEPSVGSPYAKIPAPLDLGGGGGEAGKCSPLRVLPFAAALTPDRHKMYPTAHGGHSNNQNMELLRVLSSSPSELAVLASAATPFKQSLTPGLLSSPALTSPAAQSHHLMSFARYLALTATPGPPLSRQSTADAELCMLQGDESAASELQLSCYTELDPQAVVRTLHQAFFGQKPPGGQAPGAPLSLMAHAKSSLCADLAGLAQGAARRPKLWDDPDTESDDEPGPADALSGFMAGPQWATYCRDANRAGFLQQATYFSGLTQRCSFFRTMPRDRPQPVDAAWLHAQVYPAYYVLQRDRELRQERLTGAKVLRGYLSAGLLYQWAAQLGFEDDRVASPRLAALKALYQQSAPPADPLLSAFSRDTDDGFAAQLRQADSGGAPSRSFAAAAAGRSEIAHPRLQILGALEASAQARLARCTESGRLSLACEVDTNYIARRGFLGGLGCDSGAAPAALCRAHHSAILTGCSIDGVTGLPDERPAYKARDSDANALELLKFVVACEVDEVSACAGRAAALHTGAGRLAVATRVFASAFRCYGFKLGNASELTEQPDLLNSLVDALEGLLLWAQVLSVALHSAQSQQSPSPTAASLTEPLFNSVCRSLLGALLRTWTARRTFAQDVAYLRVAEILLAAYTPLLERAEAPSPSDNLPRLQPHRAALLVARRCLTKVAAKVSCTHFKVALQAVQVLQNPNILVRYVLPSARPERFVAVRPQSEAGPGDLGCVAQSGLTVGATAALREAVLELVVDALRANRTHWHPVVQASSGAALDALFHRIEEAEDALEEQLQQHGSGGDGERQWPRHESPCSADGEDGCYL